MEIRPLAPETLPDWLEFFENRAFADHDEWHGCYCTAFFAPRPAEYQSPSKKRRDFALWLVETGRMKGYLAYDGGVVVGWVNTNDKRVFPRLDGLADPEERVLAIVCFLVQKDHRRQGVARGLLARIVADAKAAGYATVEAYPKKRSTSEFGTWNGPYALYQGHGFVDHQIGTTKVVRLTL